MSLDKIANKIVETDVLVVGGGIAGIEAALCGAQAGRKVVIVDKEISTFT